MRGSDARDAGGRGKRGQATFCSLAQPPPFPETPWAPFGRQEVACPFLRPPFHPARPPRTAFTLIELLVVIAILSLLLALLTPALVQARTLAKLTICRANLHHCRPALSFYEHDNAGELFLFANGTQDGPHEYASTGGQPGNPALALVESRAGEPLGYLPTAKLFFCPLVTLTHERNYHRLANHEGPTIYWGTYSWKYPHVAQQDDPACRPRSDGRPAAHSNSMQQCNPASADCLMMDADMLSASWWPAAHEYRPWEYEHFNALRRDGSASAVARTYDEALVYLYGPDRTPYP